MPDALLVFLAPPRWEELVRRLVGRGTEPPEVIERRLATAPGRAGRRGGVRRHPGQHVVEDVADQLLALMAVRPLPAYWPLTASTVEHRRVLRVPTMLEEGADACPAPPPRPRASPTRRSTSCSRPTDSKYSLVIYAAKRARQINAYYSQLGEGLLEYVGPLVETHVAGEAAVDRAARDQRRPADPHRRRVDPTPHAPAPAVDDPRCSDG